MKALILNGSRTADDPTNGVYEIILDELKELGWNAQAFILREEKIAYCLGCFGCWERTPGVCQIDDAGRVLAKALVNSNLVVFVTPVTFGGYSSELKKAVDRLIPTISPFFMKIDGEVHHKPRYKRYPRLMAVGVLPSRDEESERLFTTLVGRNAINLHTPAHAADVVASDEGIEKARETVKALLAQVGVGR